MIQKNNLNYSEIVKKSRNAINFLGYGPVLIHTSLPGVMRLASIENGLNRHMEIIHDITLKRKIWVAAFDDRWVVDKEYSVLKTPSCVGVLNEFYRKNIATWRTNIPLSSVCGVGDKISSKNSELIDIYGSESVFAHLAENDGVIFHYGSSFSDTTFIHHVEQALFRPLYRFDKTFSGTTEDHHGAKINQNTIFHCRPLSHHLNYDWNRLEQELTSIGALIKLETNSYRFVTISAKKMKEYCIEKLSKDPLSLLDCVSLEWVDPLLKKLGRRFKAEDFE
jgi:aminoglycoside 3-N-acetyltransferase